MTCSLARVTPRREPRVHVSQIRHLPPPMPQTLPRGSTWWSCASRDLWYGSLRCLSLSLSVCVCVCVCLFLFFLLFLCLF